jgi:magnesium chelatase family protein
LDRIDLHIEVPRLNYEKLKSMEDIEKSATIRQRVEKAQAKQLARFEKSDTITNAEMSPRQVEKYCELDDEAEKIVRQAVDKMNLSARSYHRLLKVARTIADLSDSEGISKNHIAEALQFRTRVE